jgi:thiol-disulfide isomerase/thioredoxin
VDLKSVKYAGLVEAVKSQRGKVVVVDVWADFCPPCKAAFPHLLELHQKYGTQGLTCLSVSVDLPEGKAGALKFLVGKNATIPNFWLDEPEEVWQNRWDINGPPLVFVFDRQGRRAGKFYTDPTRPAYTQEDIENLVKKLLQAKP